MGISVIKGEKMERRLFLRNTAMGMAAFAGTGVAGLGAEELKASGVTSPETPLGSRAEQRLGRPARIASICFKRSTPLSTIEEHVEEEGSRGSDLIVLPELCRGQNRLSEEPLHGPTVTAMAALAKKHKTYIATPIDRRDGDRRLNSVVLLDRSGQIACVYDKVFPYWVESGLDPGVIPGESVQVYQTDFGRVGIATCFDANFPEVWRRLSDKGAEVVVWPSEYSAGRSLQAHAINHHYYIVTSTQTPDCIVYDITGERILYENAKCVNVSRVTLDLDRGIYHQNFNLAKLDKLLKEHPEDIAQEQWMELEQWFVLKAKRPGVSARELAHQYGLEELRHYI
ncbi:MAG: carbon-nitrogen hydrolase family protein, partial [Bryocella sp.]